MTCARDRDKRAGRIQRGLSNSRRGGSMRAWLAAGKIPTAALVLLIAGATLASAQPQFPYDQEMLLDVRPLPGSKRVPILEVITGGRANIDLWCHSGQGRAEISGDA